MYTESIKKLAAKMTVMVMLFVSIFSFNGCGKITESSGNATSGSTMIESTAIVTEETTIVAITTTVTITSGTTQTSTIETTSVEKEVVDVTTIEETETNTTEETTEISTEQTTIVTTKSIDDIVQEVINGSWGFDSERETRLTEAGYNYLDIQSKVNEIMSTSISSKSASVNNSSVKDTYDKITTETTSSADGMTFVKTFTRGTFYSYGGSRTGGSGRSLIDCSYGNGYVKGSIASSYIYGNYGYNYNGSRTMVYLEISGYPSMNGYYYLDDSDAGNSNVIDFFYYYNGNCQFQNQGVVTVNCYIVG